jgi:hypothetical protein
MRNMPASLLFAVGAVLFQSAAVNAAVFSSKNCSELGWQTKSATPDVCGQSVLQGRCYGNEKWPYTKAASVCEAVGGRMCTLNEIFEDVVQVRGHCCCH